MILMVGQVVTHSCFIVHNPMYYSNSRVSHLMRDPKFVSTKCMFSPIVLALYGRFASGIYLLFLITLTAPARTGISAQLSTFLFPFCLVGKVVLPLF